VKVAVLDQLLEALGERCEMFLEQSGPESRQQPSEHNEGLKLLGREPQARQLMAILNACRRRVAKAGWVGHALDRGTELISKRADGAVEGRAITAAETLAQIVERDRSRLAVECSVCQIGAVEPVHSLPRHSSSNSP